MECRLVRSGSRATQLKKLPVRDAPLGQGQSRAGHEPQEQCAVTCKCGYSSPCTCFASCHLTRCPCVREGRQRFDGRCLSVTRVEENVQPTERRLPRPLLS